ncbi:hypothetical protein YPPY54_4288, partial [Yersinia pestis PY-54]
VSVKNSIYNIFTVKKNRSGAIVVRNQQPPDWLKTTFEFPM